MILLYYAYSFGQLLVLALYQQYRLEGQAFSPSYLRVIFWRMARIAAPATSCGSWAGN